MKYDKEDIIKILKRIISNDVYTTQINLKKKIKNWKNQQSEENKSKKLNLPFHRKKQNFKRIDFQLAFLNGLFSFRRNKNT